MKPSTAIIFSGCATLLLNGCVQTASLRIENRSRQSVTYYSYGTPEHSAAFNNPLSASQLYRHNIATGESAVAAYHVRKVTGVPLPVVGGIHSDMGYGVGLIIYHGPWTLDLPEDAQWKEARRWYQNGPYYRMAHENLGTLIISDKAADNVIVTPDGQRLPVTRRRTKQD